MSGASTHQRVLDMHRRGDVPGAEREAKAALAAAPDDATLLHLLARIACGRGDWTEGENYLRRLLALEPGHDPALLDLAVTLASSGRAAEAISLCRSQASLPLRRLEGQLLQSEGRLKEAAVVYRDVVQARPDDWEIWNNLGNALMAAGEQEEGLSALRTAAKILPDHVAVGLNLVSALVAAGKDEEAEGAVRELARHAPGDPHVSLALAGLLSRSGRFDDALELLSRNPPSAGTSLEMARALMGLRRIEEAEAAYRSVLKGPIVYPEAFLELAILLERSGRLSEVKDLLAAARRSGVQPDFLAFPEALLLDREGQTEAAFATLRNARGDVEPVRTQRLIARLAEKVGRFDEAFEAASRANETAIAQHPGIVERGAAFRQRVAAMTEEMSEDVRGRWTVDGGDGREPPIFLVGFPRSGTTLLDTMLMGHEQLVVLEEVPLLEPVIREVANKDLPDLTPGDVARLRNVYWDGLAAAAPERGARRVIDKLPLNLLAAPVIHRLFPDARFIFAIRHPCDAVLSGFLRGFELNDGMASFLDLESAADFYDRVMTFWEKARRALDLPVQEVRYEALIFDPEQVLRPLLDFLGLPWSSAVLDHQRTAAARGVISTPSYNQVTRRLYSDAAGRWRRFETFMAPVLPVLEPWVNRYGYDC